MDRMRLQLILIVCLEHVVVEVADLGPGQSRFKFTDVQDDLADRLPIIPPVRPDGMLSNKLGVVFAHIFVNFIIRCAHVTMTVIIDCQFGLQE